MSLPRMSLHIGDYRKNTGHLKAAGHGAYLLLIMHYWATGGLPDDNEQLAAIACMTKREWRKWRPIIEKLFKPGWKHTRVDAELKAAEEKYERRAAAGKKGGTTPKKKKQSGSNASAELKQPITNNQEREREGGEARAREARSAISQDAHRVADECRRGVAKIVGNHPDEFHGLEYQVEVWFSRGYQPAQIVAAFVQTLARYGPGKPMTYLAKAVESACIRAPPKPGQPLPLPSTIDGGRVETIQSDNRAGWQRSRDDWREARAELKASLYGGNVASSDGSESG